MVPTYTKLTLQTPGDTDHTPWQPGQPAEPQLLTRTVEIPGTVPVRAREDPPGCAQCGVDVSLSQEATPKYRRGA